MTESKSTGEKIVNLPKIPKLPWYTAAQKKRLVNVDQPLVIRYVQEDDTEITIGYIFGTYLPDKDIWVADDGHMIEDDWVTHFLILKDPTSN